MSQTNICTRSPVLTPSEQMERVMHFLSCFHDNEERQGHFFASAQLLVDQLDELFGVAPTPIPDLSNELNER